MKTVALFGAKGFVGGEIFKSLQGKFEITAVTRDNFEAQLGKSFDYVINSAMPAARFKAKNDLAWDFRESVEKTNRIFNEIKHKKFIQISSVSARGQLDTVYGRHKLAAESLVNDGQSLIVRLGPMYGSGLTKGVLIDMLEGKKVFVSGKSRYSFASVDFVAGWIAQHLDERGVREVGAKNAVSLQSLAEQMGFKSEFEGAEDHQEMQSPCAEFPDVNHVVVFLKQRMGRAK